MKFFHLSDLHIGLRLHNRELLEDQNAILQQIVEQAKKEQPDAMVIAGDIYDKVIPSAEAVGVFDRFVLSLKKEVPDMTLMMISGNHDSGPRVNLYREILEEQKLHMVGVPPRYPEEKMEKVTMEDAWGKVHFYLLPFVRPSMVKQIVGTEADGTLRSYQETVNCLIEREQIDRTERNILVSHQFYLPPSADADQAERMDSEIRMVGNIDRVSTEVLEAFDYAALGHIHKPMKVGAERYRYCGTPLACSVSEAGQQKAILMIELKEKGNMQVSSIPLVPLRNVCIKKGTLEEILGQASEDYVSVVLTERTDVDVLELQDRLYAAFPNLLEIRREAVRKAEYQKVTEEIDTDPFRLCCAFLNDLEEEEKDLLREVIRAVEEGEA